MAQTVTAAYGSLMQAVNAYDELVGKNFPREKLHIDKETFEVKIIIPDTEKPEAKEILERHEPDKVWAKPFEES